MRFRIVCLVLGLAVLAPSVVMAVDPPTQGPLNEVSIDLGFPVAALGVLLLPSTYMVPVFLDYQRALSEQLVLSVAPGLVLFGRDTTKMTLLQLWVELDWHPGAAGLKGFYIGPAAVFASLSSASGDKFQSFMGGLALGYQLPLASRLNLDFAFGLVGGPMKNLHGDSVFIPYARASIALGYKF
jgi:hypothetical protein